MAGTGLSVPRTLQLFAEGQNSPLLSRSTRVQVFLSEMPPLYPLAGFVFLHTIQGCWLSLCVLPCCPFLQVLAKQ